MHTSSLTTTKPSSRLCIAPLGQTLVQAGSSQTRKRGYSFDDEEHALGLRCVAACIYD
ncbi:hypothetical protein CDA30_07565, partial [Klebsiella pneumoniae]